MSSNTGYDQLEIIAQKDVVVCGGGPAGIAAAISAAKNGASVALLERHAYLGGASTASLVSIFAYGFHDKERFIIGGIFKEVRERLFEQDALIQTARNGWEPYNPIEYKILLDAMMEEYDVDVLFHANISDVIVYDKRIDAVIVPTKRGYTAIRGKVFIDCTGDGDIAAHAGAPCDIGRESDGATQPMTMMYMIGGVDWERVGTSQRRGYWVDSRGRGYVNATGFSDFIMKAVEEHAYPMPYFGISSIFTIPWMNNTVGINFGRVLNKDGLDLRDSSLAEKEGRRQVQEGLVFLRRYIPGFEHAFVVSTAECVGVRETRRIIGEYTLTEADIVQLRQFEDVIAQSCYMIDIHSPDGEGTYLHVLPRGEHHDIPYRCLIPKGIDNLVVAGRCISASHTALGAIRVQPVCMALGEAAGAASALCTILDCDPRDIPIGQLQDILRKQGAILE